MNRKFAYDQVIKLSDYNKLLELRGDKKVSLADDEYLINAVKELGDKIVNEDSIKTLTLPNGVKLKQKEVLTTGYTYSWGVGYVMPGVTIGSGCVIGAGSIVVNDIPDNSVAAGVPARVIKTINQW